MNIQRIILSTALASLVASCGLHNAQYQRPTDLPTQNLFDQVGQGQTADSLSLAGLRWQDFFADKHLQGYIQEALRNNLDLKTAQMRIEQAETSYRTSRMATLPSFALSPALGYTSVDGQGTFNHNLPSLTASWQVDLFASLRNAKRRQRAALEASQAYHQAVQSQLVASVARSYYTLVLLDEQLRVSTQTERIWGENVRAMRALFEAGVGNDAAVSMSEANYAQVRTSVLGIRQQIREAEQGLNLLLSRPLAPIERGGFAYWRAPEVIALGSPLYLLSRRPDLRAAEANLAVATYARAEARAAFYPSLTLSGSAGWLGSGGSKILEPSNFILSALASLTQPLFQRGQIKAGYKIAKLQQEEARLAFVNAILKAGGEVNNLLSQIETYQAQGNLFAERTKALERSVKATKMLMESASSTYLEVLTAQEALLSAQLQELSNRYNEIASTIALYQALGGGYEGQP